MTPTLRDALAELAHVLRPDWDARGIRAALDDVRVRQERPADLCLATIRAAHDPHARTPGVIPTPGPHWQERITPPRIGLPSRFVRPVPLSETERAGASLAAAACFIELRAHRLGRVGSSAVADPSADATRANVAAEWQLAASASERVAAPPLLEVNN